uniref:J domain-containing protein n=1 Tax=Glossina palpalis gambiensis TaxID=67801 RepID=A0A1B0BL66_9MUSC
MSICTPTFYKDFYNDLWCSQRDMINTRSRMLRHVLVLNTAQTSVNFSSTSVLHQNYYEDLGISKNSTIGEIKAAYYNLSKLYHPDKNQGSEEAAKKFRAINQAYEVLGNYKLRRLYDKADNKGRTPIYNFDEWSRAHYGQSFERRKTAKEKHDRQTYEAKDQKLMSQNEYLLLVIMIFTCLGYYKFATESSYDTPKDQTKRTRKTNDE